MGRRLGTICADATTLVYVTIASTSPLQDTPASKRSENLRPRDALYSDLWLPRPILTHVILKLPRTLPTVDGRWMALAAYSVAASQ